jgi:hypothetical protein
MNFQNLSTMSDAVLMERLATLVREEKRITAAVLLHIAEVEARGLHLAAGCSSIYVYCTRLLGMSEDEAFKRIRAARVLRRYPVVAGAVAEGRLHLTAVVLLARHLNDQCADELVAKASGRTKADIEIMLARRAPRPDVPARLERTGEQVALVPAPVSGDEVVLEPAPPVPPRVAPLSEERFALQLTISGATREKLRRAQALLRHQVPSGDLSEVLDRVLDGYLDQIERKRFGKAKRPRAAKPGLGKRTIPNESRRQAVERDGLRCSFVSKDGRRCEETGFLEFDHVVPVALGGAASDGVRVLCRSHNQYEAERILGRPAIAAGTRWRRALAEDEAADQLGGRGRDDLEQQQATRRGVARGGRRRFDIGQISGHREEGLAGDAGRQAHVADGHQRRLAGGIGGRDRGAHRLRLHDGDRADRAAGPLRRVDGVAEERPEGVEQVRQEQLVDQRAGGGCAPGCHRLADHVHLAGDDHQVLAARHRARGQERHLGALHHRVGHHQPAGDERQLEDAQRRTGHRYTKRKESFRVQRRSRVKWTAVVRPSPVGLAMVKEV